MIYLDLSPKIEDFTTAVARGLRQSPKSISPSYLYDHSGSELFEQICRQPEYYPTRTEIEILEKNIAQIVEAVERSSDFDPAADRVLVELGSGVSRKTRILLENMKFGTYIPFDISKILLFQTADDLRVRFPKLRVVPAFGDFTREFHIPGFLRQSGSIQMAFFPGSTLGNFDPIQGVKILRSIRAILEHSDHGFLLIGMDLIKNPSVLEAAYNDKAGVTEAFNKNILTRLKREAGAEIDLSAFEHRAFFNEKLSRIEMHLVARRTVEFRIGQETFTIQGGETIHTENSYKYRPSTFLALCRESGFQLIDFWSDSREWFGVFLLKAPSVRFRSNPVLDSVKKSA